MTSIQFPFGDISHTTSVLMLFSWIISQRCNCSM